MEIKGQRVVLRDGRRDSDTDDFFRWLNLEEWKYYDEPDKPFHPISREEFENINKERSKGSGDSKGWNIDTVDGQHIGWCSYYNFDQEEKSAFVGLSLPEQENWGKGYGTEALRLLLDHLFESLDLQTIQTATWTGNKRMVRCAQKAGFTNQKIMPHRSSISVRGEPLERIEFTLTRAEWTETNKDGD